MQCRIMFRSAAGLVAALIAANALLVSPASSRATATISTQVDVSAEALEALFGRELLDVNDGMLLACTHGYDHLVAVLMCCNLVSAGSL